MEQNLDELKRRKYIATNLAGRGLDILEEVLKKGGMHVSLTFLPINIRFQGERWKKSSTWNLEISS